MQQQKDGQGLDSFKSRDSQFHGYQFNVLSASHWFKKFFFFFLFIQLLHNTGIWTVGKEVIM